MPEFAFRLAAPPAFIVEEHLTRAAAGAAGTTDPVFSLLKSQRGGTGFPWELSRKLVWKTTFQVGWFPFTACQGGVNAWRSTPRRWEGKRGVPIPRRFS